MWKLSGHAVITDIFNVICRNVNFTISIRAQFVDTIRRASFRRRKIRKEIESEKRAISRRGRSSIQPIILCSNVEFISRLYRSLGSSVDTFEGHSNRYQVRALLKVPLFFDTFLLCSPPLFWHSVQLNKKKIVNTIFIPYKYKWCSCNKSALSIVIYCSPKQLVNVCLIHLLYKYWNSHNKFVRTTIRLGWKELILIHKT